MAREATRREIEVSGTQEYWELRCLTALNRRPFRLVARSERDADGSAFQAQYGSLGARAVVTVDVIQRNEDEVALRIEGVSVQDNPIRQLIRNLGAKAVEAAELRLTERPDA